MARKKCKNSTLNIPFTCPFRWWDDALNRCKWNIVVRIVLCAPALFTVPPSGIMHTADEIGHLCTKACAIFMQQPYYYIIASCERDRCECVSATLLGFDAMDHRCRPKKMLQNMKRETTTIATQMHYKQKLVRVPMEQCNALCASSMRAHRQDLFRTTAYICRVHYFVYFFWSDSLCHSELHSVHNVLHT